MPWNKAWDYISELLKDRSSHISSAMAGDLFVPEPGERATWDVFEVWRSSQPGAKRKTLKRPWAGKKPTYKERTSSVSPERLRRKSRLQSLF